MGLSVDLHDLGETGLVYFAGLAAYSIPGRVMAATVNLTDDTDRRARKSGKPAGWMLERVTRQLKKALKRAVPVLVSMEINKAGLLHAHLIVAGILPGERDAVKAALKAAGGKGYRGKQVVVRGPQPDSGWCSYSAGDFLDAWPWASRAAATSDLHQGAEAALREVISFIAECKKNEEPAKDKSKLTYNIDGEKKVNFPIEAPCVPSLNRVALLCGQQEEANGCLGKRLLLTRSRLCSKGWKSGRVPRWDSS